MFSKYNNNNNEQKKKMKRSLTKLNDIGVRFYLKVIIFIFLNKIYIIMKVMLSCLKYINFRQAQYKGNNDTTCWMFETQSRRCEKGFSLFYLRNISLLL